MIFSICTIVLTAVIALSRICDIRLKMLDLCIQHGIYRDIDGDIGQTVSEKRMKGTKVVNEKQREDIQKYLMDFDIPFKKFVLGKFYTELFLKSREYNGEG